MSTIVEKYQVRELYAELRSRLADDLLFGGASLEQMDAYLAQLPDTVQELFAHTLQGDAEAYRYGGVLLMAELVHRFAAGQVFNYDGPLTVHDSQVLFYGGDLHVVGDLVLGDQSIVVVAGDLDLDGSFVGGSTDYSMLGVSGAMTAYNIMTPGEMIVGQRLAVRDLVYLYRNSCSSLASSIRCRLLVENDCFNTFSKINADAQIDELLTEERPERLRDVAGLVGLGPLDSVERLEAELRQRLTVRGPG